MQTLLPGDAKVGVGAQEKDPVLAGSGVHSVSAGPGGEEESHCARGPVQNLMLPAVGIALVA